jgi:hypothetical protein
MCGRPGARRATVRAAPAGYGFRARAWASFVAAEVVASSVITLALPEAHVSVTWAANPFQLMMCPCRT